MNNMTSSVSLENAAKEIERDCAFGGLFQQIIMEMKNSAPLWEDLTTKSTKLHSCLRATIQAVSAFLDAFQKIADAATSTKGATKDIGTSLTRICMRHKALEAKMKTFTSSILDCLIIPLQERMEDWKKTTAHLDKEHTKEYKRARGELKKRSMETMRLQKKVRKGGLNNGGMSGSFAGTGTLPRSGGCGIVAGSVMSNSGGGESMGLNPQGTAGGNRDTNRILEVALRDVTEKRQAFEDAEKQAIRTALIEERSRFCLFVSYLKPVVDEEVAMLSELTHVQEAMQQLEKHVADPFALPTASEQVIADLKGSCDSGTWSFQTPPSSPSSLGSRKSSTCSISSANSSSSGSAHSPLHNLHNRTILHQPMTSHPGGTLRYSMLSSQDSGFTSQDTLYSRMPARFYEQRKGGNQSEGSNTSSTASSNSSTPSSPYPPGTGTTSNATWPNLQDSIQFERAACAIMNERPHTISSAYERGHQRPPLTVYTFQPPLDSSSHPASPSSTPVTTPIDPNAHNPGPIYQSASEIYGILRGKSEMKPPVPKRCSSLERPQLTSSGSNSDAPPRFPPKGKKDSKHQKRDSVTSYKAVPALPDFNQSSPDMIVPQPVYVNMHELNAMASMKLHRQQQQAAERQQYQQPHVDLPPPPPELMAPSSKTDGIENNLKGDGSMAFGGGCGNQNSVRMSEDSGTTSSGGVCTSQRDGEVYATGRQPGDSQRSVDQEKPLPPVRKTSISIPSSRNSSIPSSPIPDHQFQQSNTQYQNNAIYGNIEQHVVNNAKFCNTRSSSQGSLALDSGDVTPHASMEHLAPPPSYFMNLPPDQRTLASLALLSSDDPALKRMSVAETIKTLTEKKHQPLSPNMVRRSQSMKQPGEEKEVSSNSKSKNSNGNWNNRRSTSASSTISTSNNSNSAKDKERTNLMQVLNQQLSQVHQPTYGNMGHPPQQQQYSSPPQQFLNSHQQPQISSQQQQHLNSQQQQLNFQQQHHIISQQQQHINSQQQQHINSQQPQHLNSQQQLIHSQHQQQYYANSQQQSHLTSQQQQSHINSQQQVYQQVGQQSSPENYNQSVQVQGIYQGSPQPIYQQVIRQTTTSQSASNSPRNPRRFSEELLKTTATFVQNRVLGNKTPPPVVTSKEIFVQTLNAKLSQMRVSSPPTDKKHTSNNSSPKTSFASKLAASVSHHPKGNSVGEMSTAFRVRQWISSKANSDPSVSRESLMDQIRHGTRLRQTRAVNDRSAPRMN